MVRTRLELGLSSIRAAGTNGNIPVPVLLDARAPGVPGFTVRSQIDAQNGQERQPWRSTAVFLVVPFECPQVLSCWNLTGRPTA